MRTTLNLDEDVLQLVKNYAEGRSQSLGEAVSELVKRGLANKEKAKFKMVNGLPLVVLPPGSPAITTEDVKRLEDELE